jgi:hypothetical protein
MFATLKKTLVIKQQTKSRDLIEARKCSSSDMHRSANYISDSMTHLPQSLWGDDEGFR